MQISVDLTLSPLQNDYEAHIIDFIKTLRNSEFKVLENPLSTQIFGDFEWTSSMLLNIAINLIIYLSKQYQLVR